MKTIHCLLLLIVCFGYTASAQNSAFASISATIVQPVSTSKLNNLDFGKFVAGETAGSISIYNGTERRYRGNLKVVENKSLKAASFSVSSNNVFDVSLQNPVVKVFNRQNADEMIVQSAVQLERTGDENRITIGAKLTYHGKQMAGTYVAEQPLEVVVNFN
jgi:hypothetical protein